MLSRLRRRPDAPEHAVLAWRAPRETVRDRLERELVAAAVGPESEGWTLVRVLLDQEAVVDRRGRDSMTLLDDVSRYLDVPGARCITDGRGGGLLLVFGDGPAMVEAELFSTAGGFMEMERGDWERLLSALGTPERLPAVLEAADGSAGRSATTPEASLRRAHAVARVAGLPGQLFDGDLDPGAGLVELTLPAGPAAGGDPDALGRRHVPRPAHPGAKARMPSPLSGVVRRMRSSR
jgi:hypothetical protein